MSKFEVGQKVIVTGVTLYGEFDNCEGVILRPGHFHKWLVDVTFLDGNHDELGFMEDELAPATVQPADEAARGADAGRGVKREPQGDVVKGFARGLVERPIFANHKAESIQVIWADDKSGVTVYADDRSIGFFTAASFYQTVAEGHFMQISDMDTEIDDLRAKLASVEAALAGAQRERDAALKALDNVIVHIASADEVPDSVYNFARREQQQAAKALQASEKGE